MKPRVGNETGWGVPILIADSDADCRREQREIAKRLFISPKTVATHIQRILSKLDVHSRAEAVARAHREGLVGDTVAHSLVDAGPAAVTNEPVPA